MNNQYFFNEPPLVLLPSLAVMLKNVDEAIVLQQLHYWMQHSKNERDGRTWVYNTAKDWQQQFPFWSEDAIWRIMKRLKDKGFIITANYNKMTTDRTTWYSIDYEKLDSHFAESRNDISQNRGMQYRESAECNQRILQDTTQNNKGLANDYRNKAFVSADSYTQEASKAGVDAPTFVAIFNLLIDAAGWRALVDADEGDKELNYAKQGALTLIKMGTNDTEKVTALIAAWKIVNEWRNNALPKPKDLTEYASQVASGLSSQVNGKMQKGKGNSSGTYRKADTNSSQHISSAEAEYVMPAKYR
jgi:hypothetical protein